MDMNADKYAEITSDRPLGGVPYFFVGDEGFALNRNILRTFGGSNLGVNKRVHKYRLSEHLGAWNVLLEF
jgi:hypothetical protein